ncbi:uncharacterized protein LOC103569024 [Microplitis demolitor]|uniref:uncharacterized protein LOC103569024 n=1 Tax=Microplitis demolitor TaxID=69319 RepID=UPI0004CDD4F2|nr:uncharacterized protein LOC103569024 [Microplitis demolitor]
MIVVALICFTFIASGSCQVSDSSDNDLLNSRLIDTLQFKRYLSAHRLKPVPNYSPDQISSEPGPDPKIILENIKRDVDTVREKLYQTVEQRLSSMVEKFENNAWEYVQNLGKYIAKNYEEKGNSTLQVLDGEIKNKLNSFVSSLMMATNQAVENYNDNASLVSKRLDSKIRDLNVKINEAEKKIKAVVENKGDTNDVNTSIYDEKSILTDLDGKKINLFDDDDEGLILPKISES